MKFSEWIQGKKDCKVGFIGGSITEGAGSSTRTKRYASQLVTLLQEHYPDVAFSEINAGIGGTGSNLGLFRAERDLISKEPDIVFVEFSVNDSDTYTERYMESLVRYMRRYRAELPIVFVYTLNKPIYADYYAKGILGPVAALQEKIAKHYGIPSVPAAIPLCRAIGSEEHYGEYLTDNVHPNDKGHKIYADAIMDVLADAAFSFPSPTPLNVIVSEKPTMVTAEDDTVSFAEFPKSYNNFYGRFSTYFYAYKPGASLTFAFDGKAIGIYHTIEKDSGDFEFSIDGGAWEKRSTWDIYALRFNRVNYSILKDDLEEGHHVLRLRVLEEKAEKSEGTYIRIGAFLIG